MAVQARKPDPCEQGVAVGPAPHGRTLQRRAHARTRLASQYHGRPDHSGGDVIPSEHGRYSAARATDKGKSSRFNG